MVRRALLVAALALSCGGDKNTPVAVAERFLDYYFIEIDQQKALPLVTGRAREAIEEEIRQVAAVRAGGYGPADAKGKAYYEQTYASQSAEDTARFVYDLTMELGEGEAGKTRRHVLLSMKRDAGRWKVASFTIREGPAQRAP